MGFCLKNTYFLFQGSIYEEVQEASMGSPISPIVANPYVEDFETKAIRRSNNPHHCEEVM